LSNLSSVVGYLVVAYNNSLANLDGLSNLSSVINLLISDNTALTNLDGLSNLTSVGNDLDVINNPALTNLDGLGSLTSLSGGLRVDNNCALTNLDGLANITSVGYLYVKINKVLNSFCGLYPLLSSNGLGGSYDVEGNLVNPTQQQIIDGGACITSSIVDIELKPMSYKLLQNYPNPFNPTTKIRYQIKSESNVQLTIYDISGQDVKTLVNKKQNAGEHSISFDASGLASGIYIYRLNAGSFEQSRKMILLR